MGSFLPLNTNGFINRFGNLTSTSISEVLICSRGYTEQASQAQRSVVSTSVQDAAAGTGAKAVRITYLDSNYVLKTEDITMNGTTAVNTVATDIRFIEDFEVIQGATCAGAVKIMTTTGGGGSEFCGMSAGTNTAFLCHHYVPAGNSAVILEWGATVDTNANVKLKGQQYFDANLVDQILDLDNLTGIATPPGRINFSREPFYIVMGEKTYIRVTVVPSTTASTVTRGYLNIQESPL